MKIPKLFATLRYVKTLRSRRVKALLLYAYRYAWARRSYWLRLTLAFGLALCFTVLNRDIDIDYRFQMRPPQSTTNKIVVVEIQEAEWVKLAGLEKNYLRSVKESNSLSDRSFWNLKIWKTALQKILRGQPAAVGVTFFFAEDLDPTNRSLRNDPIFRNQKVVWATQLDREGHILPTYFASSFSRNAGLSEMHLDSDGVARSVVSQAEPVPNFAYQLLRNSGIEAEMDPLEPGKPHLINYRGEHGTFPILSLTDVIQQRYPKDFLKDKIILISAAALPGFAVNSPLGRLSIGEYYANIVDNFLADRWVQRVPFVLFALFLAIFVWLSAWVTSSYPQFLALVVLVVWQALLIAAAFTLFDIAYLYLPLLPLTAALLGTYMIFLSFQLSIRDYQNLQLEKEKDFLVNVEELKNNFFSLISHDLKTPIAKIQGICDRMLSKNPDSETVQDIDALKDEARELNRYIKTLLHLTRVESKDFRVNREPLDLNEVIEQVIEIVRPLAAQKSINLVRKLEPMFLIEADSLLMTEVVLNLIENAIKYSPPEAEVVVSSREVDGRVIVLVEDKGPGISLIDQQYIFNKFYRGEEGLNHSKGSGLGLYLVKYFIERHEGFVLLDSTPGQGTKVGFSVPVQAATLNANEEEVGEQNAYEA